MLKTIFVLFILLFIFSLLLWFVGNDGNVSVNWLDYQIETSVAFALILAFCVVAILAIFINFISWLKDSPKKRKSKKAIIQKDKGLIAITQGFAAVASGDFEQAKKLTAKAQSNLGEIPLTKLA